MRSHTQLSTIAQVSNAEELILSNNDLDNNDIQALSDSISQKKIKRLDISNNKMTRVGAEHLAKSLQSIKLKYLDISNNMINDEGFKNILLALKDSNIVSIQASNIGLQSDFVDTLLNVLPSLKKLKHLDISNNKIAFKELDKLQELKNQDIAINTDNNPSGLSKKVD